MPPISPTSKFSIQLGGAVFVAGWLFFAGWYGANLLRDIREEISALRGDVRAVSTDRWTGRDMRDFATSAERLNPTLHLPDPRRIQRENMPGRDRYRDSDGDGT